MAFIKFCVSCLQEVMHNELKGEEGRGRCTYCGYPPSSNPAKRDHQKTIMDNQVARRKLLK